MLREAGRECAHLAAYRTLHGEACSLHMLCEWLLVPLDVWMLMRMLSRGEEGRAKEGGKGGEGKGRAKAAPAAGIAEQLVACTFPRTHQSKHTPIS